jgi:hypothetical protein
VTVVAPALFLQPVQLEAAVALLQFCFRCLPDESCDLAKKSCVEGLGGEPSTRGKVNRREEPQARVLSVSFA